MEVQRKAFADFLAMNLKKATATDRPVAHVQFYGEAMEHDAPLLLMDQEDILAELDKESSLVRWLLNQLTTYDCTKQKLVALIFDRSTIISDVFWVHREVDKLE